MLPRFGDSAGALIDWLAIPGRGYFGRYRSTERRKKMAAGDRSGGGVGGISLGGIIVIIGIVLMIVWSFWIGLIILLIGLIAFGGFARGKWY
jgi:hypothetical protein